MHYDQELKQRREAADTLRALAMGVHPATAGPVTQSSILHDPVVIRAMILGAEALQRLLGSQRSEEEASGKEERATRIGKAWSSEEDDELRDEFARRVPLEHICAAHQRTGGSIYARLVRLNLVTEREEARRIFRKLPSKE